MKMKICRQLASVLLSLLVVVSCFAETTHRPPNIVVLLIDDLGRGDVSCYGCPDFQTPHIDSIARDGVLCTNGYTACPLCSPSRTALITGMYPERFGVYGNTDRGQPIPDDHPTVAEFMRDAGYVTGMIGRWDVGDSRQGPIDRGFTEVARRPTLGKRKDPNMPTYYSDDGTYWTDIHGPQLAEFVTRHRDEPFFLYYAPLAIHSPVEDAPDRYRARISESVPEPRRSLGATLLAADDAIGMLLDRLKQLNLDDQTLIFFTGDNGGWNPDQARNLPFRGGKATGWEGGIHEPYLVRWTGHLKPGQVYPGLVSTLDIYATAAALSGKEPPPHLDGVNIMPYLEGAKTGDPHENLFWHWESAKAYFMKAVRHRNMRYVVEGDHGSEKPHLYDLEADPGETQDLVDQQPQQIADLANRLSTWEAQLKPYVAHSAQTQKETPGGHGWAYADAATGGEKTEAK